MIESETVTSETTVNPNELKQLISRLANPNANSLPGAVKIKDIAETLEVDENVVIGQLMALRKAKKEHPVPIQTEKMAAVLDSFKSTDYKRLNSRQVWAAFLIPAALLAIMLIYFNMIQASYTLLPQSPRIEQAEKKSPKAP